ncbi:MAG: ABC transporter permease [Actinomycetota bacterium]
MTRLVRTELLKIRTARLTYGLLGVALVMTVLSVAGAILTAGLPGTFATDSPAFVRSVAAAAWSGGTFVLILGILSITGEFRHGTVTSTFLVTPRRGRVVVAKMVAGALVGLLFSVVACALTVAVALPWLGARGIDVRVGPDVVPVLLGVVATTTIYGMVGVGLGALVRNQVAAVVTALVWTSVLEGVAVMLLAEVGRWLPGGAVQALFGTGTPSGGTLLPGWGGALLLVAYGLAFALAGSRFVLRRDVT